MSAAVESGAVARTALRVRYPETDRMGVAYHAHYFVWFELGRTELLREQGRDYATLEEQDGVYFPVVRAGIRYRSPARYDDELIVSTRVAEVSGATLRFEYHVVREADARLLAEGFTEHAAVGRNGKPFRLPAALRERLAAPPAGSAR
jgi:acyl-CoA thioester hydrolase